MKFGTDGIRGVADGTMTVAALKLGNALGRDGKSVFVGRDTRPSGATILSAFAAGVIRAGGRMIDLGIIPTAGVAYATAKGCGDYGVVISASHNPEEYNGLKVFDGSGYKLGDKREQLIGEAMDKDMCGDYTGVFVQDKVYAQSYIDALVSAGKDLSGMRILLDCANGAAYRMAPEVFKRLGAAVTCVGVNPDDGINCGCGSTFSHTLKERCGGAEWDIAFTFDGDSDRLIAVDETGDIIDGDRIMYYIACRWAAKGILVPKIAVGTVLSNTGTEQAFIKQGVEFLRSNVGDKYVMDMMKESGAPIGGEQSGHIILAPLSTTGDGILSAVVFASLLKEHGIKASEAGVYPLYPQISESVIVYDKDAVISSDKLRELKENWTAKLGGGRVLVRASGTEPKIRVMAECMDLELAKACVKEIADMCIKIG
ncbi:MAG: phosphoglucosamine mutase [Clostridia bacterium]|nr:phosphoglucosamine mutase [Clostridia bacterium]